MAKTKEAGEILMDRKTFPHPVEMQLTDREIVAYAMEAANLAQEDEEVTKRHQSEKGKFKADTERIAGRRSVVLDRIRTGREFRDVECYGEYDYFAGMCEVKRVDNDETVMTRKMTVEEFRGERLPFQDLPDDIDDIEDPDTIDDGGETLTEED